MPTLMGLSANPADFLAASMIYLRLCLTEPRNEWKALSALTIALFYRKVGGSANLLLTIYEQPLFARFVACFPLKSS